MAYPILAPRDTWYTQGGTSIKRNTITAIDIKNAYTPAGAVTAQWDGSAAKDGSITVYIEGTKLTIAGNGSGKIQLSSDASMTFSGGGADKIYTKVTQVNGLDVLDTSACTDLSHFFRYMISVETLDVSGFNTSNVTSIKGAFAGHPTIGKMALRSIVGLENWDTHSVTDMTGVFYLDTKLTDLSGISKWNTAKVTTLKGFLQGNNQVGDMSIEKLDISEWDVSSCETLQSFLYGCSKLQNLDLSGWRLCKIKNMFHAFADCYGLRTLKLGDGNMPLLENINGLLNDCRSIVEFDVSGWKTPNLCDVSQWFERCTSLRRIIGISSLDVSNVGGQFYFDGKKFRGAIAEAFNGCNSLEALDFSGWDLRLLASDNDLFGKYKDTFSGCTALKKITIGANCILHSADGDTAVLPVPGPTYIPGADGTWYTPDLMAHTPEEAVKIPNTYYASKTAAERDQDAVLKNGILMDIGEAVTAKSGKPGKHRPQEMAQAIREISTGQPDTGYVLVKNVTLVETGGVWFDHESDGAIANYRTAKVMITIPANLDTAGITYANILFYYNNSDYEVAYIPFSGKPNARRTGYAEFVFDGDAVEFRQTSSISDTVLNVMNEVPVSEKCILGNDRSITRVFLNTPLPKGTVVRIFAKRV